MGIIKFTEKFWDDLTHVKVSDKTKEQSNEIKIKGQEALGDALDTEPPGGDDPDSESEDDSSSNDSSDTGDGGDSSGDDLGDMGDDMDFSGDGGDDGSSDSGDSSGGDSGGMSGGGSGGIDSTDRKIGENPFAQANGRELITQKIQELAKNIDSTMEAVNKVPKVSSVIVNNLQNLKDEVSKLLEIVYVVPLEETIVRYSLCVQTYEMQVSDLSKSISILMHNHNTEEK